MVQIASRELCMCHRPRNASATSNAERRSCFSQVARKEPSSHGTSSSSFPSITNRSSAILTIKPTRMPRSWLVPMGGKSRKLRGTSRRRNTSRTGPSTHLGSSMTSSSASLTCPTSINSQRESTMARSICGTCARNRSIKEQMLSIRTCSLIQRRNPRSRL